MLSWIRACATIRSNYLATDPIERGLGGFTESTLIFIQIIRGYPPDPLNPRSIVQSE